MNEELEAIIKDLAQAKRKLDELKIQVVNDVGGENWRHVQQVCGYVNLALNYANWLCYGSDDLDDLNEWHLRE